MFTNKRVFFSFISAYSGILSAWKGKQNILSKNEVKKEVLMKRKIKDKNRKTINKNIAFSLMGMGLMLGLGACNASQNASAATVSANVDNDKTQKVHSTQTAINVENNNITITGEGASSEGNIITINKSGNYRLSGKLYEGQIVVNAYGEVNLNLDNFVISNSKDAPIVGKTGNLNINLADGSDNKISDTRAANTQTENSSNDSKTYECSFIQ